MESQSELVKSLGQKTEQESKGNRKAAQCFSTLGIEKLHCEYDVPVRRQKSKVSIRFGSNQVISHF